MTNDVVDESSQGQPEDMDQGSRKRSAPKEAEEELAKKRLRDNANAQLPEATGGEQAHSGQRSDDVEELDGEVQENAAEQAERPVDDNDAAISEGGDVATAPAPAADTDCPPAEHQQQEDPVAVAAATADDSPPSGPPPQPSKQYLDVKEALITRIEAPPAQIPTPAWTNFSDYLGEGIKTRLLSLATLHLTESGAAHCPDAVRQLNANANRILLGAAPNCELYQERVVRALAHQVGARLLVVDSSALQLDDLPPASKSGADVEHAGMGPGGFPDGSGGIIIAGRGGRAGLNDLLGGYGTSDEDEEDPAEAFLKSKAKRFMENDKMIKNNQQFINKNMESIDAAQKKIDAERKKMDETQKKLKAEMEESMKAHEEWTAKFYKEGLGKAKKELEKVDGAKVEAAAVEKEEEKRNEDDKVGDGDGAGPSSSAPPPAPPVAEEKEKKVTLTTEDSKGTEIDHIKHMLQMAKDTQKAYEEILEHLDKQIDAPSKQGKSTKEPKTAPSLPEELRNSIDSLADQFMPGGKVRGMGARGSRGRGGAPGGVKRAYTKSSMEFDMFRGGSQFDASRRYPMADTIALAAAINKSDVGAPTLKQGDRVCYLGSVYAGMPALISEERDRAGNSSLSAYMSISWLERREANKRKMSAAKAAAAAAAAAAAESAAAENEADGTSPPACSLGRVLSVDKDTNTVHIAMDYPFTGGKDFTNQPEKCGFTCSATDLSLVDDRDDAIDASFRALFDLISSELKVDEANTSSSPPPLIIFLANMDRMVRGNDADTFRRIKERLSSSLPARCLFIGGYCTRSLSKEKSSSSGPSGLSMLFGGSGSGGGGRGGCGGSDSLGVGSGDDVPVPWYERFGSGGGGPGSGRMGRSRGNVKGRAFASMFPNAVELHPPHADGAAKAWKKMLDQDIAAMREKSNRAALRKALDTCDVVCEDMEAVKVTEVALSKKEVEQVVGAAVATALIEGGGGQVNVSSIAEDSAADAAVPIEAEATLITEDAPAPATTVVEKENKKVINKLAITPDHLMAAAASIQCLRAEAAPVAERSALKDLNTDQYERQLLSEVVPPEEIAVGFHDIGALDAVKNTLHEIVILPLQRPELFTRGALTRPAKGLLLFGPPGTGKTMLAKAVASESGAHFININMSAITSKWLGEGERLVRAVFSLAHKLAPSVIFIDEIDSFLAKRGGHSNEHEALRKMKTEFLAGWDGLRTKQTDRVLVLAATNRPMDLDDAAIRRMPRRLFVPLPDADNREKILRTILKDEDIVKDLDFMELGKQTDGYSGSDLKNLAIAAAYCPLRELLEVEKKRMSEAAAAEKANGSGSGGSAAAAALELPPVRSINMADFTAAMKQVTPSTHAESASTSELQKWNEQFGEGGSRKAEPLVYYT